ncbi:hypothetical protein [Spongiimicrobium sp. 2-473A-2-J]|uniref:hypothetical protein n=1 Tax=Eudoraea algarum TaxID=3417568 RepID=UPI003D36A402
MHIKYESLQTKIKRKHSFKYKPEFSESFKTDIPDGQIIPLAIEVFKKLEWPVVFINKKSVEAKRQGDYHKLTEKVTITKGSAGRIEVHSKSLESNFWDVGKNSKRTGLFIVLFQKLALTYKESGKLAELETEFEKQYSWEDYEVPAELPKPKPYGKPNPLIAIGGGLAIAIGIGLLVGLLSQKFIYFILLFEVGIGLLLGYLFNKILRMANYMDLRKARIMLVLLVFVIFVTNQYFQFYLILTENNIPNFGFIAFQEYRLNEGFTIDELNTGWIGLVVIWIVQLVIPFFLAQAKVVIGVMNHIIERIPEKVLEYVTYLLEMGKSESEIRAELSAKDWRKKADQDNVFDAVGAMGEFRQNNRE